jgi:protein disulfide-isomerase
MEYRLSLLKNILFIPFLFFFSVIFADEDVTSSPSITWEENYEQAVKTAYKEEKPILLYFSGSDWCRWCKKLKAETFNSKEFTDYLSNFFVFINIDFPKEKEQSAEIILQNSRLKTLYKVQSFPTVIIMDHKEKELDRLGYLKGGGKAYREKVFQVLKDFEIYKESMSKIDQGLSSQVDLEDLYKTAKRLDNLEDASKVLTIGLEQKDLFFLAEKYQILTDSGRRKSQKALSLKTKILDSDSEDKEGWHYRIAVVDFQANLKEHLDDQDILLTLKPLMDYLGRFGNNSNKNTWRVQITVSQTLLGYNRHKEALSYAKQSLRFAPKNRRNEILQAVRYIQTLVAGIEPHGEALGKTIR